MHERVALDAGVIIVGAGAAGLAAARELGKAGKQVVILEARERMGGRIYPLSEEEFGYPAQGGAEFVHGDAPLTKTLLAEAGATLTFSTEWWNVYDGVPTVMEKVSPHDLMLEDALKELKEDMTVTRFLETHFSGEKHAALRDFVLRRVEAYDAADPDRASARGLFEDISDERGWIATNIREGYGALVEHLASECRALGVEIELEQEVVAVDVHDKDVSLTTRAGERYEASQVIITVPLPLIKEIVVAPAIPEKLEAVEKMGYGNVIKILLRFRTKWWGGARERNFEKMFFMFSKEVVPTWWTQYPEPHTTLTGWVAGPAADRLASRSDDEIIALALTSLANIFKISVSELEQELVARNVIQWGNDPFALGAYSYYTPESEEATQTLLTPVGGRLFYTGEALYAGDAAGAVGGTVEAALASGIAAARKIL